VTQVRGIRHFYIPEDQSVYLLSHKDAEKLRNWVELCTQQLQALGYRDIALIGKGAFGFVFAGVAPSGEQLVFKFSRINLPEHVQARLEEEAFMLSQVEHVRVPALKEFQQVGKQAILVMERAKGLDFEQISLQQGALSPRIIVRLAVQLGEILLSLRSHQMRSEIRPVVHGDIKPSNLMWDASSETVGLIDWGSSVFAQLDEHGQHVGNNVMDLMSGDIQQTNSRLGDVYFIGPEQISGGLSSPRFDEQGLAATLYALASGQSCRYGVSVITPNSLGLPKFLANVLTGMLSSEQETRQQAGDYFFNNLSLLKNMVLSDSPTIYPIEPVIPVWVKKGQEAIDTVVYGSRKSFLREASDSDELDSVDDVQLEKYYKNYLIGMGDTEKAFIAAVSRLGDFPVVGGLAIRWEKDGVYIDSNLSLFDESLRHSFQSAVNNMVSLAQGIFRIGMFKSCLFDARNTLHIYRDSEQEAFEPPQIMKIPFEVSAIAEVDDVSKLHSYFEDGKDPDEYLYLPDELMAVLAKLNLIHHTGCIIFEVLPTHLKIHSYLMLLDHQKQDEFTRCLAEIVSLLPLIDGLGISGFMKLPYKDTRFFEHISTRPDKFYPNT